MKKVTLAIQAIDENGTKSIPTTVDVIFHEPPVIDTVSVNPTVPILGMPVSVAVTGHSPDGLKVTYSVTTNDPGASVTPAGDGTWTVATK